MGRIIICESESVSLQDLKGLPLLITGLIGEQELGKDGAIYKGYGFDVLSAEGKVIENVVTWSKGLYQKLELFFEQKKRDLWVILDKTGPGKYAKWQIDILFESEVKEIVGEV